MRGILKVMGQMEPEAYQCWNSGSTDNSTIAASYSQAISLKHIADALEKLADRDDTLIEGPPPGYWMMFSEPFGDNGHD